MLKEALDNTYTEELRLSRDLARAIDVEIQFTRLKGDGEVIPIIQTCPFIRNNRILLPIGCSYR